MATYHIRKIRGSDEVDMTRFVDFLVGSEGSYVAKFYEKHRDWLHEKGIPGVRSGERIAFGAFHRTSTEEKSQLVGTAIIKKVSYTAGHELELKTFLVNEQQVEELLLKEEREEKDDYISNTSIQREIWTIRRKILKAVERFAQKKGYQRIECTIPADNIDLQRLFLDFRYSFAPSKPSPYKRQSELYIVEKNIQQFYWSDPFDFVSMVKWIFLQSPTIKTLNAPKRVKRSGISFVSIPFEIPMGAASIDKDFKLDRFQLKGECLINDDFDGIDPSVEIKDDSLFPERVDVRFVFSYRQNDSLKAYCETKGIRYFNKQETIKILGEGNSPENTDFDPKELGGILLAINSKYINKVKDSTEPFVYFLLDGFGNALDYEPKDGSNSAPKYALFYSPFSQLYEQRGEIWGYAEIEIVNIMPYETTLKLFDAHETIFSKGEFTYNFSNGLSIRRDDSHDLEPRQIVSLHLGKVSLLAQPADFLHIASDNLRKKFLRDLVETGLDNSYVDRNTTQQLIKQPLMPPNGQSQPIASHETSQPSPASEIAIKSEVEKLVEGNRLMEALDYMLAIDLEDSVVRDEFISLKRTLTALQKDSLGNLLTWEDANREQSRIARGILHFLKEI